MLTCKHADCFVFTSSKKKTEKGLEFLLLFILPNPKLSGLHLLRADNTDNNRASFSAQRIFDIMAAADNLQLHKPNA